jgi:hypothetical protein
MTAAVLRKELQNYIATMPEKNLIALRPLLSVLSEPFYTVETNVTPEEIAMINEGMAEYRANPSSFIPLENLK